MTPITGESISGWVFYKQKLRQLKLSPVTTETWYNAHYRCHFLPKDVYLDKAEAVKATHTRLFNRVLRVGNKMKELKEKEGKWVEQLQNFESSYMMKTG